MTPDPLLEMLIRSIERRHEDGLAPLNLRLTVHVGAMFVTGILIPEGLFIQQAQKPLLDLLHETRTDNTLSVAVALDLPARSLTEVSPQFIHFSHASFSGPVGDWDPPGDTTRELWRCRLASIDGYVVSDGFARDSFLGTPPNAEQGAAGQPPGLPTSFHGFA